MHASEQKITLFVLAAHAVEWARLVLAGNQREMGLLITTSIAGFLDTKSSQTLSETLSILLVFSYLVVGKIVLTNSRQKIREIRDVVTRPLLRPAWFHISLIHESYWRGRSRT